MVKTKLPHYISREFFLNFLLSFFFFFFIFFMNQLLLMLQRDEVKNLSVKIILELILLSTPQFLTYTFPFSSLTSTAMVIGDLSSKNEIIALRSLGISLKRVFLPILFCSIIATFGTYIIADQINPWASEQYKKVYANIIHDMPTMALKPNSTTVINNVSISTGDVVGNELSDIKIMDTSNFKESQVIVSKHGKLLESNDSRYVFTLLLEDPQIMTTNNNIPSRWSAAKAKKLVYTMDMSSLLPAFGEPSATQVRNKELLATIDQENDDINARKSNDKRNINDGIHDSILQYKSIISNPNTASAINSMTGYSSLRNTVKSTRGNQNFSFKKLYFESEYHKRFALSFACIILAILAFSISFFKVKNGRLIGFALSMFIALAYWVMLFVVQVNSMSKYNENFSVMMKMWLPNAIFLLIAIILLGRLNKT